jgi:hydroxypyruvate isomerase
MQMGVFTGTAEFGRAVFASGRLELRDQVLAGMRDAVDTARRVNARWCSIVPGKADPRLSVPQQTANVIETLKRCADVCEPAGLVMLLEPIGCPRSHESGVEPQRLDRGHPGLFLRSVQQAFEICLAVGSPSCKILLDVYQQDVIGGNVLKQIDRYRSEIAYYQIGDNPGRKEPGTGDIDFAAIFHKLQRAGYEGIVGMDHGNSLPGVIGERAVIDAYVRLDAGLALHSV